MHSFATGLPSAATPETKTTVVPDAKGQRWFELCLVLFFSFGSSLNSALYLLNFGPPATHRTPITLLYGFTHALMAVALLRYVLSRSGRTLRDIGFSWSPRDIPVAVLLLIVAIAFEVTVYASTRTIAWHYFGVVLYMRPAREFFGHLSVPLIPYLLAGPVAEELIVRAYLMTEIRALTGSAALAVVVSVLAQGSYHLYYGWFGASIVSMLFVVFALYYSRWRRALPVLLAHEFFDLLAMFRL